MSNGLQAFYISQLQIHLRIIEKYQFSSNPEHVAIVKASWFAVARYEAKLAPKVEAKS